MRLRHELERIKDDAAVLRRFIYSPHARNQSRPSRPTKTWQGDCATDKQTRQKARVFAYEMEQ